MKRLLELLRPRLGRLWIAGAAMLLASGLNVISLYTLQPIIDRVFLARDSEPIPLLGSRFDRPTLLLILALFFSTTRLLYAGVFYLQRYLMLVLGEEVVNEIRKDLARHLLRLTPDYFQRKRAGDLVANLSADLGLVQNLFSTMLGDLLRRPLEVVLLLGFLFYFDARLALASLAIAPLIVLAIRVLSQVLRRRTARLQEKMGDLSGRLAELASGIRTVQSFRAEEREGARFSREAQEYLRRARRTYLAQAAPPPVTEVITALGVSVILYYGGSRVLAGAMTPGTFFTFMAMLMAAYQPVKAVVNAISDLARVQAGIARVEEILAEIPRVAERPGARALADFRGSIRFEGVGMRFDDGTRALDGIDLEIRRGETIALVGPSGAGKTTLAHLLVRFFDPTEGRISIDGADLRDLTLDSLRRAVGLVTQESFLFHDTIRENLRYASPRATEEEIRAAAASAQILARIEEFPEGLETIVGERGQRLSGGERQRIAIARTLLADPPILLLDEATSALDAESERAVQRALEVLMKNRTTIVIAHRLSTVTRSDRIVVLDAGRIRELGRHEALLAQGGLYARLYSLFLE